MSIRSGQIVYTGSEFIVARMQNGGVTNIGIPETPVYELGNYQMLTTIRDTPDLSFSVDSTDVSCDFESLLLGESPGSAASGEEFNLVLNQPLSILSNFRSAQNFFNVTSGVIVPHLFLESVSYKFGLKANAEQTYSLKGDSVFFVPGVPQEDTFTSDGATLTWNLTQTALEYYNTTLGLSQYVVNLTVLNPDGTFDRLFNGLKFDFTDSATSITFNSSGSIPVSGATFKVQYGTTASENITQVTQAQNNAEGITVSPAAIRSKDIDVYVGNTASTPVFSRWTGVQSVDLTWKVNLDANMEFGNPLDVSMDFVTPDVTGTITTRDNSTAELFAKIAAATNVPTDQVAGALSSTPVPVEIRLSDPSDGSALKTLYVPDARFEPPATQTKVNQKLETPFKFMSDSGQFYIYDGERPGSEWVV